MSFLDGAVGLPGGAERLNEPLGEEVLPADVVTEVGGIDPEPLVRQGGDFPEPVQAGRLAVGREAHDFVLVAENLESEKLCDGRIHGAQAVRPSLGAAALQVPAPASAHPDGLPLADAVHREDGRLFEGRGIKGAGGVGEVVINRVEGAPVSCSFGKMPPGGVELDVTARGLDEYPDRRGEMAKDVEDLFFSVGSKVPKLGANTSGSNIGFR